jgi:hypothetical protein
MPGSEIRIQQFLENNQQDFLIPPSMIPRLQAGDHALLRIFRQLNFPLGQFFSQGYIPQYISGN